MQATYKKALQGVRNIIGKWTSVHWIAAVALFLALFDTFVKSISLTALGLLLIAALPWIVHLFRSIELPGGLKIEMRELEKAGQELADAGLLKEAPKEAPANLFPVGGDPNLALAGLRIEIEKRVRKLAAANNLPASERGSVRRLIDTLTSQGVISLSAGSALRDLLTLLNNAVHGAETPADALRWAMELGPQILAALDERIGNQEVCHSAAG